MPQDPDKGHTFLFFLVFLKSDRLSGFSNDLPFQIVVRASESVSRSVVSDSLQLHGLEPARFLCPRGSPGKNTGMGLPFPSPEDLPDPGIQPRSPTLSVDALPSEPPGKSNE